MIKAMINAATIIDADIAAYAFECDADLAELAEAQRMSRAFANQGQHCGYCLFMRDLSSAPLTAQGTCPICDRLGRS